MQFIHEEQSKIFTSPQLPDVFKVEFAQIRGLLMAAAKYCVRD